MIDDLKKALILTVFVLYVVFYIKFLMSCAGVTAYEGSEFQSVNESIEYMQD